MTVNNILKNISINTKLAGVIGNPISHSLSPKIHNHLLAKYNIDGIYLPLKVKSNNLKSTLMNLAEVGFRGFNITLPHKEKAYEICDKLSNTSKAIKAVNTIFVTQNAEQQIILFGHNTDGYGFIENIKNNSNNFDFKNKNIFILGAGGATRSIVYGLIKEGVARIIIANRTEDKVKIIINDFKEISQKCKLEIISWGNKEDALKKCDLLINSTSLGMVGADDLKINLDNLDKKAIVTDIVYNPLMTNLLRQAQRRGNKVVTGIGMLIYQAFPGFKGWYQSNHKINEEFDEITNLLTKDLNL
jgi:shikimate dehydrogenase